MKNTQEIGVTNLPGIYTEATLNFRHYSNLRFAVMTLFFAVIGGILTLLVANRANITVGWQYGFELVGMVLSLVFLFLEEMIALNLRRFAETAKSFEDGLGVQMFSSPTKIIVFDKQLTTTFGTRTIFGLSVLVWAFMLLTSFNSSLPEGSNPYEGQDLNNGWDKPEVATAIAAIVIAALTAIFNIIQAYLAGKGRNKMESLHINQTALVEVWGRLGQLPEAFRFHDISKEDFLKHGVTAPELAYLVANFEAASFYYQYIDVSKSKEEFPPGSIRLQLCKNENVRTAWPLIRRFFTDNGAYVIRIEATMDKYGKEHRRKNVEH